MRPIHKSRLAHAVAVAVAGGMALAGHAQQSVPDAGIIIQTQPRAPKPTSGGPDIEDLLGKRQRLIDVEKSFTVRVDRYTIGGLEAFSQAEAQAILKPYVGASKTFQDLLDAAGALRRALVEAGHFLADVIIPEQDVSTGTIELIVLEGRLGQVEVEYAPDVVIKPSMVEGFLSSLKPGERLRAGQVERALLLINDLSGIVARFSYRPGTKLGTADLRVRVEKRPPVTGFVDFDINGIDASGRYRWGGNLEVANLLQMGGTIHARAVASLDNAFPLTGQEHSLLGRAGFDLPLGSTGFRAGASYTGVRYDLDPSAVNGQLLEGDGRIISTYLSYPIIRSRNTNLRATITWDARSYIDRGKGAQFGPASTPFDNRRDFEVLQASLSGDNRDYLFGGGLSFFSVTAARGRVSFLDPNQRQQDANTFETAGSYGKYSFGLGRLQELTPNWLLFLNVTGQVASKNLDNTEKIILGGPYGIRALSPIESRGDHGYVATVEGRRYLLDGGPWGSLVGAVFYDFGAAWFNDTPLVTATRNNVERRSGFGVGFYWEPKGWYVRGSMAFRVGDGPTQSTPPDPFLDRMPRIYLQAIKYF